MFRRLRDWTVLWGVTWAAMTSSSAVAQADHEVLHRLVVFPVLVEKPLQSAAEAAWWDLRASFANTKRFVVASKSFMERRDVYQPRGDLQPADVILLSRLLDAHALVTTSIQDQTVKMSVYESRNGQMIWERRIDFHSALPRTQQIPSALLKLSRDFIASLPYQGYVIVDPLQDKGVNQRGPETLVRVHLGADQAVKPEDPAQIIRVTQANLKPLFLGGANVEVLAEGNVTEVGPDSVTVRIDRLKKGAAIRGDSLVRFPREFERLVEAYAISSAELRGLSPEIVSKGLADVNPAEAETKPLVTAVAFLINLAIVALLAF